MWLLNATSKQLENITPGHSQWPLYSSRVDATTSYAILSHTWEDDELSFQDVRAGGFELKKGYRKVERACHQALHDGFRYVWVDTCCIDKSSSAELSEAINSMFRYYRDAAVCYAYLCDVPADYPAIKEDKSAEANIAFTSSRWFTRGWTLQELIAPSEIRFFGSGWNLVGSKKGLERIIAARTGIPRRMLGNPYTLEDFSVAQRMSWAASRACTREEDRAYSLLGIFDINMPLLYGEEGKAFFRLQEEIIKKSTDHSIFAWTRFDANRDVTKLLAPSPDNFGADGGRTVRIVDETDKSFAMTNAGLRIVLPLQQWGDCVLAILNCRFEDDFRGPLALVLNELTRSGSRDRRPGEPLPVCNITTRRANGFRKDQGLGDPDTDTEVRVMTVDLKHKTAENMQDLIVLSRPYPASQSALHLATTFWIRTDTASSKGLQVVAAYPSERWNPVTGGIVPHSGSDVVTMWAYVELKQSVSKSFVLAFGVTPSGWRFHLCGFRVEGTEDIAAVETHLFRTVKSWDSTFDLGDGAFCRATAVEMRVMGNNVWVVDALLVDSADDAVPLYDLKTGTTWPDRPTDPPRLQLESLNMERTEPHLPSQALADRSHIPLRSSGPALQIKALRERFRKQRLSDTPPSKP